MHEYHHSDLVAKKSLGQNFLTSDIVPGWMCDAANVSSLDTVVEIGPGTGALTAILLARGARVIAIETDTRAQEILSARFDEHIKAAQLCIIAGDIREERIWQQLPDTPYKIVANIPYYLSGFLLRLFLEQVHQPTTLVFLMQKEVVERITRDKKSSLLSLSVAVFGAPKYIKTVGKGHFSPQPKVDSAILAVTAITNPFRTGAEQKHFFTLLHLGFGKKRKQLIANLSGEYPREFLIPIFTELGLSLTVRAVDIPLQIWHQLNQKL